MGTQTSSIKTATLGLSLCFFMIAVGCQGAKQESEQEKKTESHNSKIESQQAHSNPPIQKKTDTTPPTSQKVASRPVELSPNLSEKKIIVQDDLDRLIKNQKEDLTLNGVTNNSTAAEVTEKFIDSLAKRDQIIAERFLTVPARVMTNRVGLQLSPIASQKAKYITGDTTFATKLKKVAYVDCHVHDPMQGEAADFTITWVLKRNSNHAWRISGMRTMNGDLPNLISFENFNHVQAIVQSYGGGETSLDDKTQTERYASEDKKKIHR